MLTVGRPMSLLCLPPQGCPVAPLLLLGWDHTGKHPSPSRLHGTGSLYRQSPSPSWLGMNQHFWLKKKKKKEKKTQPTTLLFLWGGGRLCQRRGIGLQCLAWGRPRFDVGLDPGAVAPVPCPCRDAGLSLPHSLSPQRHRGSKQSPSHPIPSHPAAPAALPRLPTTCERLNGKRAWLGATETLLLHVISLITS